MPKTIPLAIFGSPRKVVVPVCEKLDEVRVRSLSDGGQVRIKPVMVGNCLSLDLPELYCAQSVDRGSQTPLMISY